MDNAHGIILLKIRGGGSAMDKMYVTITGMKYYYGKKPFKVGKIVALVKDRDNEFDAEAIRVQMPHIETVGYVANSTNTVFDGTMSAGRLYDKIDEGVFAIVEFITHSSVIARVVNDEELTEYKNGGF